MKIVTRISWLLSILYLAFPLTEYAGGLFLYEVATSDIRLASAGWAARANDPSTVFTNPAGMSLLDGPTAQVGVTPIYNNLKFQPNSLTNVSGGRGNGSTWLPSGTLFASCPIDDDWTAGFATLGYWGSGLNYGRNWVGRYYITEALLQGLSFIPAVAYRINDSLSIGLAANLMYGLMMQKAAINNVLDAHSDGSVRLLDTHFAAGAIVGALYQIDDCTRVGVQYMSPVHLRFKDKPKFHNIGPLLRDILADTGVLNSSVTIKVNVPASLIGSIHHQVCDCFVAMADLGWQQWSKLGEAQLMLSDPGSESLTAVGKYNDTWHVALGAEYFYTPDLKFSGGIAYDSSMLTTKNRTFSLPIGSQWRFGTGLQYLYDECIKLDAAYELMWSGSLSLDQNRGPLLGHVAGKFPSAYAHFLSLSLTYSF